MRIVGIDKSLIKEVVFSNIMAKVSNQLGMETDNAVAPIIFRKLGLGFESVRSTVFDLHNPNSVTEPIMRSCVSTVDQLVEKFSEKNGGELFLNEGTEGAMTHKDFQMSRFYAFEAEELKEDEDEDDKEVETDEDGESGIAIVVADLLKEVAEATSTGATELAERVISLTKEENKNKEDEELNEDEVSSEKLEDGDDDKPFGDTDGDEDDDKKNKDGDGDEDENKDNKGNPFDEGGDTDDASGGEKGESEDGEDDDKKEKKGNTAAFENVNCVNIKDLKIDLANFTNFLDGEEMRTLKVAPMLENDSISNYVNVMADSLLGDELSSKYNEFGLESSEFKEIKKTYKDTSVSIFKSTVGAMVLASALDLPFNTPAILNPLLEM